MSFTLYNPSDIVIDSEEVVAPLWSGNMNSISNFYTSSVQEQGHSGLSFLNVYQSPTYASGSEIQFAIAYANISGSGSAPFNNLIPGLTPTRAIYGQYRNLIYGDENSSFTFGNWKMLFVENLRHSSHTTLRARINQLLMNIPGAKHWSQSTLVQSNQAVFFAIFHHHSFRQS